MPKHQIIKQLPGKPMYFGETEMSKPIGIRTQIPAHIEQWQDSITWHKIEEEDEIAFRKLALNNYGKDSFEKDFAEGIEIPDGLVGIGGEYGYEDGKKIDTRYPYIIKQKEETQDDVKKIEQLIWLGKQSVCKEKCNCHAECNKADEYLEWFKKTFTIKRR